MKKTLGLNRMSGMTLIEISLTLGLLIGLSGVMAFSFGGYWQWKLGKKASAALQSVYIAQKCLFADRPTTTLLDISADDLIPYLPGHLAAMPVVESLEGTELAIDFQVMPPVVAGGYDPSGCPEDGIWDIGKQ